MKCMIRSTTSRLLRFGAPYLKIKLYCLILFENEKVTGNTYKRMLHFSLFPRLQRCPEDTIFQQDGASINHSLEVIDYLDRKLPIVGWEEVVQLIGLHALQILPLHLLFMGLHQIQSIQLTYSDGCQTPDENSSDNLDYRSRYIEKGFQKCENSIEISCTRPGQTI